MKNLQYYEELHQTSLLLYTVPYDGENGFAT